MKVGDREYCLAQRLAGELRERLNLQPIAASTLDSALGTIADLERQLDEARALIGDVWECRASVEDLRLGYQVWLDNELCERFKRMLRVAEEKE